MSRPPDPPSPRPRVQPISSSPPRSDNQGPNGLALASFVLGAVSSMPTFNLGSFLSLSGDAGALLLALLTPAAAIVLGASAINQIAGGTGTGHGFAKAGIVLGIAGAALQATFFFYASTQSGAI